MLRTGIVILVVAAIVLASANLLVLYRHCNPDVPAIDPATPRGRWQALSADQQRGYARQYQALARRGTLRATLLRARQFGQLSADRQQYLRGLHAVLQDTLGNQPPSQRRELLRSSPSARAFFVYQALLVDDPERLAALRSQQPDAQ